MLPSCVSKCKNVIVYNDTKGYNKGVVRDGSKSPSVAVQVMCNFTKGMQSGYIGVHADSVSGKEASVWREVELDEFLFEVVGAFEVGSLLGSNLLQLVIDPNAEGVEEAPAARDNWSCLEGRLMDLDGQVEYGERIFAGIDSMLDVLAFTHK